MPKSPKNVPDGFEEAPQAPFEGEPLSGSVSDWVKQLERDAEQQSRAESMREIRSKAGKHRKTVENDARRLAESGVGEKRSARGGSLGGSNDPRTRAAAGLNPVAGLDISLEDAERLNAESASRNRKRTAANDEATGTDNLASGAVTATVDALAKLIE